MGHRIKPCSCIATAMVSGKKHYSQSTGCACEDHMHLFAVCVCTLFGRRNGPSIYMGVARQCHCATSCPGTMHWEVRTTLWFPGCKAAVPGMCWSGMQQVLWIIRWWPVASLQTMLHHVRIAWYEFIDVNASHSSRVNSHIYVPFCATRSLILAIIERYASLAGLSGYSSTKLSPTSQHLAMRGSMGTLPRNVSPSSSHRACAPPVDG